ncbi:MAG: GNAT family N-acetyltransferase [Treponema sp.]|uniref:GNAT family N-acetyltransferase n=1 Tax=Treponema sp. TaxID=166 RepID=UPI00298D7648|nr:GNAT family N-acetyltransferase [Treponema sp.]MBR5933424.1 GNAT family N-acetyltransferase [Treponema sp.]
MENEREQAVHFLEDNERECTALMEQIIQDAENVFVIEKTDENIFCAFFCLKNSTTLLHYIPFVKNNLNYSENQSNEIIKLIKEFLSKHPVSCVYGEYDGSVFINSILEEIGKKKIKANEYILMENDFSDEIYSKEIEIRDDVTVKKCNIDDLQKLFVLEQGYQIEEVQVMKHDDNEKLINFILNRSLTTQNVFAAFLKDSDIAVAKVATNGIGIKYYQIGGVYCKKDYRSKGITKFALRNLLNYIQQNKKKAVLFVKVNNENARKLYESLKFVPCGQYMIAYFEK